MVKKVKKITNKKIEKSTKKEPLINKNYIKICPKCGSKNVTFDSFDRFSLIGRGLNIDVCRNCNYTAKTFPEIKSTEYKKVLSKLKKMKK